MRSLSVVVPAPSRTRLAALRRRRLVEHFGSRRSRRLVAPCSPMATGGAAAGNLVPCLRAKDLLHPGFRGDGDPAYGPSLVVGSCQFVTMNWASEIPNLEYLTRPAEPISYHGMPGPEACSRCRREGAFQEFGNVYVEYMTITAVNAGHPRHRSPCHAV